MPAIDRSGDGLPVAAAARPAPCVHHFHQQITMFQHEITSTCLCYQFVMLVPCQSAALLASDSHALRCRRPFRWRGRRPSTRRRRHLRQKQTKFHSTISPKSTQHDGFHTKNDDLILRMMELLYKNGGIYTNNWRRRGGLPRSGPIYRQEDLAECPQSQNRAGFGTVFSVFLRVKNVSFQDNHQDSHRFSIGNQRIFESSIISFQCKSSVFQCKSSIFSVNHQSSV